MLKSFKYRIYPTSAQIDLINKHIGSSRFVYNLALETKKMAYTCNQTNLSAFDLIKQLPDLKNECYWLKDVNSQSLQTAIKNLDNAFTRFYKGQGNFPKFKSKKSGKQSFHIPQNVKLDDSAAAKVIIPKFKEGIKVKIHRLLKGQIKSATISKTPSDKYYISILSDTGEDYKSKSNITKQNIIGIDLGLKSFLITSKGNIIDNPKYLRKAESKLRYIQRKFSKNKGKRTRIKLAKLHEKVANQRKDFLHKESFKLISENKTICIEDLNVKGMLKNRRLSKSIQDVGWSMFRTMLEYKSEWYGVNLLKIGRYEPSSKTCSNCGTINKELTLKDRGWQCTKCNIVHDRDINAAINIKNMALKKMVSGTDTKNRNELPALVGVMTSEAQPIGFAVGG